MQGGCEMQRAAVGIIVPLGARLANAQGRSDAFPSRPRRPPSSGSASLLVGLSALSRRWCIYARQGLPRGSPRAGAALCGEGLFAQVRGECVDRRGVQPRAVACFAERRRGRAAAGGHGDFAAAGKLLCESSACGGREGRAHAATVSLPLKATLTSGYGCPPLELVPAPRGEATKLQRLFVDDARGPRITHVCRAFPFRSAPHARAQRTLWTSPCSTE